MAGASAARVCARAIVWTCLIASTALFAHGPLHEQIAALDQQIAQDPNNAGLYLQRGELHRLHQDWRASLADYDRALQLDPKLDVVDLARGEMYVDAKAPNEAVAALDRFLGAHGHNDHALTLHARAQLMREKFLEAAEDYT